MTKNHKKNEQITFLYEENHCNFFPGLEKLMPFMLAVGFKPNISQSFSDSAGGCGFDSQPGHTKDFKNGTWCFLAKGSAFKG